MGTIHSRFAGSAVALALLGAALAATAGAANDPSAGAFLAGALKPAMQKELRKQVPGLAVTKVTCYVPTTTATIKGNCTARFTVAKFQLKGVYQAKATLSGTGGLTWSATSRTCSDMRGRRASCTGESNTGNGLISAQLAETQLLRNGIDFRNAKVKVKSAICQGQKSSRWRRGEFDDVYARLKCSVKAADGGSYGLVFRMVGSDGYNLTSVVKR